MSKREVVVGWVFALAYTGYVAALSFGLPALLGNAVGAPLAFVLALAPLVVGSIVMAR